MLVRTVGEKVNNESTVALAAKSLECGMNLLKDTNDPDLKKSVYGLFASVSMVMKRDMNFALSPIVDKMINSIKSSDGVVVSNNIIMYANIKLLNNVIILILDSFLISQAHYKDNEDAAFPVYDNFGANSESEEEEDIENTDNEEDEDDDDIAGFSVENAYVEEKEEAILALKEIAQHTE